MAIAKPEMQEYRKWLKDKFDVDISSRIENHYDLVTSRLLTDLQKSDFWKRLASHLPEYDDEYLRRTGYYLLMNRNAPQPEVKPFESFLLKSYRKNVQDNNNWPESPNNGWILPANWFSRIDDILRALVVVKYLDGAEFLASKINQLANENGLGSEVHMEAREDGYYAAHVYTRMQFEIPKIDWDAERITVATELQITTQLQEVIRKLLRRYYEQKRQKPKSQPKWQWDCQSDEFATNYLGHILHYIEGMIMEIRDKPREIKS